jgi:tRNA threonylcarbamoyladenosine biosynthesis protein TsaE
MEKIFSSVSLSDLKSVAREIKNLLGQRTLLLFAGEVGAGKTTLIGELCALLGMEASASPSFAIHHRYERQSQSLDHVDLYRVRDEADLESTGFWDLLAQETGWVIVEWADLVSDSAWPMDWDKFKIDIKKLPDEKRRITITHVENPTL